MRHPPLSGGARPITPLLFSSPPFTLRRGPERAALFLGRHFIFYFILFLFFIFLKREEKKATASRGQGGRRATPARPPHSPGGNRSGVIGQLARQERKGGAADFPNAPPTEAKKQQKATTGATIFSRLRSTGAGPGPRREDAAKLPRQWKRLETALREGASPREPREDGKARSYIGKKKTGAQEERRRRAPDPRRPRGRARDAPKRRRGDRKKARKINLCLKITENPIK